jgi:hypothetical protein
MCFFVFLNQEDAQSEDSLGVGFAVFHRVLDGVEKGGGDSNVFADVLIKLTGNFPERVLHVEGGRGGGSLWRKRRSGARADMGEGGEQPTAAMGSLRDGGGNLFHFGS